MDSVEQLGNYFSPGESWWQLGSGCDEQKQWTTKAVLSEALSRMMQRLARRGKNG